MEFKEFKYSKIFIGALVVFTLIIIIFFVNEIFYKNNISKNENYFLPITEVSNDKEIMFGSTSKQKIDNTATKKELSIPTSAIDRECVNKSLIDISGENFYEKIKEVIFSYNDNDNKSIIESLTSVISVCEILNLQYDYNTSKKIISNLVLNDLNSTSVIGQITPFFQEKNSTGVSLGESYPSYLFSFYDISDLCEKEKEKYSFIDALKGLFTEVGLVDKDDFFMEKYTNNFCEDAIKYQTNKDLFNMEIINFKNWPSDDRERKFSLVWKTHMLLRFLPEIKNDEIKSFCSYLPNTNEQKDCVGRIGRLIHLKEFYNAFAEKSKNGCQEIKNELVNHICSQK